MAAAGEVARRPGGSTGGARNGGSGADRARGERAAGKARRDAPGKAARAPGASGADTPGGGQSWTSTWPAPGVLGTVAGLFAAGFLVGGLGAFVHPMHAEIGVRLPLGLLLALLCIGGIVMSAGLLTRSRMGAGVPALGWAGCVLLLTQPRSDGDVLIAANAVGYGYLLGGLVALGALVCLPYGRPDRSAAAPGTARRPGGH